MAARAEQHQMQQHMQAPPPNAGNNSNGGNNFNFAGAQPARRPPMTQQGISGMGGMGGSMRPPGKSGLTFDHILNRLQGELEKSRETGAELHTLTGAMNEIHDTLGGGSTAPSFPHSLPSVRPASPDPLTDLQSQLKDTQTSLSQHIDRIRVLEDALKEQEAIRHEVRLLRDLVEARREDDDDTDDDARSVDTVVPHELESVEEEEEDDHSLGRPRTPEPSSLGMVDSRVDDLTTRLTTLSVQLESALTLSSTLQAQHSTAQSTISALETKVQALESLVKDTILAQQQQPPAPVPAPAPVSTELTTMINEWKKSVQGQWSNVQEEWAQERERLGRAREEWESKVRLVDDSLERMEQMQRSHDDHAPPYRPNGHVHGLVTPPSPRSLSSDSNRPRRKRRGRSGSGGSRRRASEERSDTEDTEATLASEAPSSEHTKEKDPDPVWALATPAPSIASMANGELAKAPDDSTHTHTHPSVPPTHNHHHNLNMGAAVGVVLLSVAAAAVVWKVKPGNV
ncbi:hypothetical protein BT96DRAFT_918865 [Gymnopus androsaceus JB14]|uniref:Uncharacterized protein n=1 Tax=Gymnopus androsaceus JB14 TaxID=1447944 RepID=A0A6A4HWV1_9AGAR|nr:hypothetical protein BT96DRAFT_918865 [Gymnopus androsaceus JB14]